MRHYKPWTNDEDRYLSMFYGALSLGEVAEKLGRTEKATKGRAKILSLRVPKTEYAIYKGDSLLAVGTVVEIADQLGIKEASVRTYIAQSRQRRANKNGNLRYGVKIE